MKFIWEASDIKPGRKYGRADISERWMIGYLGALGGDKPRYVSVSTIDGMVTDASGREELARELTEHGYVPAEYLDAAAREDGA